MDSVREKTKAKTPAVAWLGFGLLFLAIALIAVALILEDNNRSTLSNVVFYISVVVSLLSLSFSTISFLRIKRENLDDKITIFSLVFSVHIVFTTAILLILPLANVALN